MELKLKVIAYARNGHTDKFGIPRQSREESPILTRIVFEPEFSIPDAVRELEKFSHIWILWGFSEVDFWSPTVRPPRLGGNKRVGVFATRSPFRPNPLGLSSVKLIRIQQSAVSNQLELLVSGADVMDGTPIYDIKPYLSFSDSHPEAVNGFAEETKDYRLTVSGERLAVMGDGLREEVPEETMEDIKYILSQDPRPAYQDDPSRVYKMDYKGWRVEFTVDNVKSRVYIQSIYKVK